MKPMEAWEMEAVFIFTGIMILLVAAGIGILLVAVGFGILLAEALGHGEQKRKETEDPCEQCIRWPESNGVDEDCPIKEADCHAAGGGSQ